MNRRDMQRKLARARRLDALDWRYFADACVLLFIARLRHGFVSANRLLCELRQLSRVEPAQTISPEERRDIERFAWALAAAANHAPWRSDCLLRALATAAWLKRRGLPHAFYVGTKKMEGEFVAHAWLSCCDIQVTGGNCEKFDTLIVPHRANGPSV